MSDTQDDNRTPEEIEADNAPDNAANPIAIKRKRRDHKDRVTRENEAAYYVLNSVNGRLLLRTILFEICGVDSLTDANAAYDSNGLHYKAGAREAGMRIRKRLIEAHREGFLLLMAEQLSGEDK